MANQVALLLVVLCAAPALGQGPGSAPAAPPREELTTFDGRRAEITWTGDRWQLVAAGVKIKDFDQRDLEAREALRVVRKLGLTQHASIGAPRPVLEYWLANGQAPVATTGGLQLLAFDPNSLRVEEMQGHWCLRDPYRVYFIFGNHPEDALHALAVIRRYGFNQVGFVGQPMPVLVYFLGTPKTPAPLPALASTPLPAPPAAQPPAAPPPAPVTPASLHTPAVAAPPHPPQGGPAVLPDAADPAERVPFDWRQVRKKQEGGDWKLMLGDVTLADFGKNERDAQQALFAIRYYRFTEQCVVGKPAPVFTHYLVDGHVPRELMIGVHSVAFQPDRLAVQQRGSAYLICDGDRPLLQLGGNLEDARRTLALIQREKCDHLCHIGGPDCAGLTFLARSN